MPVLLPHFQVAALYKDRTASDGVFMMTTMVMVVSIIVIMMMIGGGSGNRLWGIGSGGWALET
eukprot:2130882-Karenia_brevis.AAC.1